MRLQLNGDRLHPFFLPFAYLTGYDRFILGCFSFFILLAFIESPCHAQADSVELYSVFFWHRALHERVEGHCVSSGCGQIIYVQVSGVRGVCACAWMA